MQQCRNEINMMGLLNQFIYVEKEHITKRVFLWDRGRNNVLTGTLKLKIPWNLQTCKELTPILHLVINTLQRKRQRTNLETEWLNNLQGVPKLRTYILFKSGRNIRYVRPPRT